MVIISVHPIVMFKAMHVNTAIYGEIGDASLSPNDLMLGTCHGVKTCRVQDVTQELVGNMWELCIAHAAPEYYVLLTVPLTLHLK